MFLYLPFIKCLLYDRQFTYISQMIFLKNSLKQVIISTLQLGQKDLCR